MQNGKQVLESAGAPVGEDAALAAAAPWAAHMLHLGRRVVPRTPVPRVRAAESLPEPGSSPRMLAMQEQHPRCVAAHQGANLPQGLREVRQMGVIHTHLARSPM